VEKYLKIYIENSLNIGKFVIIEGQYTTPEFNLEMIKKYGL